MIKDVRDIRVTGYTKFHSKSVLGERGISLHHSKLLYQQTGVLLPVGSHEFLAILLSPQIK